MAELNLTQEEIDERIAILKRFRKLLEEQRNKFREYLDVLEKQQSAIENGDTDAMLAHTELEQQIVANIGSLQKVITPIEKLYEAKSAPVFANAGGMGGEIAKNEDATFIPHLKTDLIKLQQEVLMRNRQNCEMLRNNMSDMKTRMAMFRNPYKNSRSIYANYANDRTASLVNLQG